MGSSPAKSATVELFGDDCDADLRKAAFDIMPKKLADDDSENLAAHALRPSLRNRLAQLFRRAGFRNSGWARRLLRQTAERPVSCDRAALGDFILAPLAKDRAAACVYAQRNYSRRN